MRRIAGPCAAVLLMAALAAGLSGCGLQRTRTYLYPPCDLCGR